MPKLLVIIPGSGETLFDLNEGTHRFGRSSDNDIQVDDGSISSKHAEIVVEGEKITVKDLGSTNGTTINGEEVTEQEVGPDDSILFGSVPASIKPEDAPAGSRPLPDLDEDAPFRAATQTRRPEKFSNASPFPKKTRKSMDGTSKGILALFVVALVVFGGSLFMVLGLGG
jgi:pSer/pThr/pTyr-binding forkhead associated (FHA) protein